MDERMNGWINILLDNDKSLWIMVDRLELIRLEMIRIE